MLLLLLNISSAKPQIAIIVDDLGPDLTTYQKLFKIPYPLTLSIMPGMTRTKELVKTVPTINREILIHFPWEAISQQVTDYPIHIADRMKESKIKDMIQKAVIENPRAVGVNNHMGSLISTNKYILEIFMSDLKGRGLFFVDSLTINKSEAYQTARQKGVKTAKNSVFLDYKNTTKDINRMFARAVARAKQKGTVIAICHANRINSMDRLPLLMDEYSSQVDFVLVSELVK